MITSKGYVYPNLIGSMASNGDNITTLSQCLGIGYQALSARLKGKKSFELPEILFIMDRYGKSFDDLFCMSEIDSTNNNAKCNAG